MHLKIDFIGEKVTHTAIRPKFKRRFMLVTNGRSGKLVVSIT